MTKVALNMHEGRTDAAPEKFGMDSRRIGVLDSHFAGLIETGRLQAASYLIARNGSIVAHRAMGKLTNKADSVDLKTDSIRQVYSITKVFTAVAIMRLVEEGKLFLSQSVANWIKEFDTAMHRNITIWHLMTHTSGLTGDPGQNMEEHRKPWYEWWAHEKRKTATSWESGDWIKIVLSGPMRAEPGKLCIYNTAAFSLLAEIIARASGVPYEEYLRLHIWEPLGMSRTFFRVPEQLRSETCYTGGWEERNIFHPEHLPNMPPKGGNGMYSSLEDLWKFGQAMLDGGSYNGYQMLGRRTVEMMVSDQLRNVKSGSWGLEGADARFALGWALEYDDICTTGTFSHEGYGRSGLFIDPKEKLVFVYYTPTPFDWVPESVINPRAIVWSSIL